MVDVRYWHRTSRTPSGMSAFGGKADIEPGQRRRPTPRLLTRLREVIDLPSSGGKRILDRYLNMFVPCILRRRVVDENVFVRRNCKPDMDLKPGTVTVLLTRCDHSYAASDDVMIVFLQLSYLTID
jgi:hypothetical protein